MEPEGMWNIKKLTDPGYRCSLGDFERYAEANKWLYLGQKGSWRYYLTPIGLTVDISIEDGMVRLYRERGEW